MEVILRQAVEKLGHPGDIVKVSAGYARNYLLPRGFAYEATTGNRKRIEQERQRLEQAEEARRGSASEQATRLEQVSLTFSARVGDEVMGSLAVLGPPRMDYQHTITAVSYIARLFDKILNEKE